MVVVVSSSEWIWLEQFPQGVIPAGEVADGIWFYLWLFLQGSYSKWSPVAKLGKHWYCVELEMKNLNTNNCN